MEQFIHAKPLIIRGARQVGKTAAARHLGKKFAHFVKINFEAAKQWGAIFEGNLEPSRLLLDLESHRLQGSTLRSMHAFLQDHPQTPYGIRFST